VLIALFVALLGLIFLSVPVIVAIGVVAFGGILALPELAPVEFPRKMFAAIDSFSLLALPYFILAGELMVRGGMSRRLVEFAETLVGHLRGGLGHATVLANMIFANVTGSSVAATSAIGSLMAPEMKARNYKPGFIAALAAISGVIGAIIPPSMVMVVYGAMAGVSIGGLFLGGFLPGLIITGLVLTMFIESLAVLIILTPLIVKIGATFAFDPIHLGRLMVMATQIGATTPPVAVCLFVGTSLAGCRYDETIRRCWPFIAALLTALIAVFLWPPFATWIPNAFLK